jgi:dienelactone hydrolase
VYPLLILTNGYDATVTDMYFASAVAASRRGYHCLLFDGPGQGEMLYEHGLRLRADWETVVNAVVDFALTLPMVDPTRIALSGWSLGGHLAPRVASGEHRLAACIADPGQPSIAGAFRGFMIKLGVPPEAVTNLGEIDQQILDGVWQAVMQNRKLRWSIVQRGFWVHGVDNLRDYLRLVEQFTMEGRAELIRCPTLMTLAEADPLTAGTQAFFDALRCPKDLIRFSSADGAGDHCEMANRSRLNRSVLDWLDGVLGCGPR